MIEACHISKTYKPKKGVPVKALDDISIKFPDTGMVFLLGKSGSGKSTLLNVLGGLDVIDSGEIFVKGQSCKDFKQAEYDSYRNAYIGFIFQEYNLLDDFTVGANVALAIELQGRKATDEEVNKILQEVDLDGYGARRPNELSGGQKQRVAIARALVKSPEIIMADEPTGALDSATGKQVFETLKKLSETKLVIIVSHDRDFAENYADRIIELADGHIIADDVKVNNGPSIVTEDKVDDLKFEDNIVTVRKGYHLTEEDLSKINEYLSSLNNDLKIKTSESAVVRNDLKNNRDFEFKPTDNNSIITNHDGYKLIKSKMSLKNAFKLGVSGLKHKKGRLVVTIILSFVAFTLFGLADTIGSYDSRSNLIRSLYDQKISYAAFTKEKEKVLHSVDAEDESYWTDAGRLDDTDLTTISEGTGLTVKGVNSLSSSISLRKYLPDDSFLISYDEDDNYSGYNVFTYSITGITEFNNADLEAYNYTLLSGRLPTNSNEIAITRYTYEMFKEEGFVPAGSTDTIKAITPENMCAQKLAVNGEDYNVVGIVDTNFDYEEFRSMEKEATSDADQLSMIIKYMEIVDIRSYSLNNVFFIAENSMEDFINVNIDTLYQCGYPSMYNRVCGDSLSYIGHLNYYAGDKCLFDSTKTTLDSDEILIDTAQLRSMLYYSDVFAKNDEVLNIFSDETSTEYQLAKKLFGNPTILTNSQIILLEDYNDFYYGLYLYDHLDDVVKPSYTSDELAGFSDDYDLIVDYIDKTKTTNLEYNSIVKSEHQKFVTKYLNSNYLYDFNLIDNLFHKDSDGNYGTDYISSSIVGCENLISGLIDVETLFVEGSTDEIAHIGLLNYIVDAYETDPSALKDLIVNTFNVPESYLTNKQEYIDYGFLGLQNVYDKRELSKDLLAEVRKYVYEVYTALCNSLAPSNILKNVSYVYDGNYYTFDAVGVIDLSYFQNYSWNAGIIGDLDLYNIITDDSSVGYYDFIVGAMPNNKSGIAKVVDFTSIEDNGIRYSLNNIVTQQLGVVDGILEYVGELFLAIGIFFCFFAMLMTSNFITTSVNFKKHDIGILRAIGSRRNDVFMIFFAESFIIACINFVLSLIGTLSIALIINKAVVSDIGLKITVLSFGFRQIALLLVICVGIAWLATFLPVLRHSSKRPIDAIRER